MAAYATASSRCHTGSAFLAQSPQLAKQMAIAADFERVYEVGPGRMASSPCYQ
jgi:aspartyl/asparaginyl-tRNA synthetase